MSEKDDKPKIKQYLLFTDFAETAIAQAAKAQIQRELAMMQTLQSQYEKYAETERAADRMPKDIDEWQRDRLRSSFHS